MAEENSVYIATPLESIPLDVPLPFPIHIRVADKYVKFRSVNDKLTTERVNSLGAKIDAVFIEEDSWKAFLSYLEDVCDVAVTDPLVAAKNIHALITAYGRHLEQMKVFDKETVHKLRKVAYKLAELSVKHPNLQSHLLKRYKETSVYFSNHSANVAVYSIAIAKKLGLNLDQIKELAFACLVHNIGYSLIPQEILYKAGKLDDQEWKKVRAHAQQGAELLEYIDAPTEVVLTVRQHHEHLDGKGYPNRLSGDEIHLFARICSIADVYDALVSQKPYGKPPMTPKEAVEEMRQMTGKFDPKILDMVGNA